MYFDLFCHVLLLHLFLCVMTKLSLLSEAETLIDGLDVFSNVHICFALAFFAQVSRKECDTLPEERED